MNTLAEGVVRRCSRSDVCRSGCLPRFSSDFQNKWPGAKHWPSLFPLKLGFARGHQRDVEEVLSSWGFCTTVMLIRPECICIVHPVTC